MRHMTRPARKEKKKNLAGSPATVVMVTETLPSNKPMALWYLREKDGTEEQLLKLSAHFINQFKSVPESKLVDI